MNRFSQLTSAAVNDSENSKPKSQTSRLSSKTRRRILVETPQDSLEHIRQKMESVARDFSEGRINRAQFNAVYGHYSERRAIIQRLMERNPQNDAWKQVAAPGHTGFLKSHFEAHPQFYVVFRHRHPYPLATEGEETPKVREQVGKMLRVLWHMDSIPRGGLARKSMGNGQWLVLASGEHAVTFVVFSLQPSAAQQTLVRDLHADFERANRLALMREQGPERMVFPQRALLD